MENVKAISSSCPEGRHVWVWAGDTNGKAPEGTPCICGKMLASYKECPTCKQEIMVPVESK